VADIFSWVDENGHTVISDSIADIPDKYRAIAKKISVEEAKASVRDLEKQVEKAKKKSLKEAKSVQREVGDVVPFVKDLDLPSFGVGVAFTLLVVFVLSLVRRTGRVLIKVGLLLAVVVLVCGSYFAWLRRAAGLGDTKLASPTEMIEDARDAAKAMEKRLTDQKRMLEKIEKGAR
jgi:hypothetical protein